MKIQNLRKYTINEEIDYVMLSSLLSQYAQPRAKIRTLLKNKTLIRVKKGLYVFGQEFSLQPYSKEVLANLIYGPSCISLEYALAYYGMIPERVQTVTSVTNKRNKEFDTPIGHFSYRYINPHKYPIGITQLALDATHHIIIASPEKALADKILLTSDLHLFNIKDVQAYLIEDLRIEREVLRMLNFTRLKEIAKIYKDKNVDLVLELIKELKHA